MKQYIIKGGRPLQGEVQIGGAKNAALGIIVAAIMADEPVLIENLPEVDDVKVLLDAIEGIGAVVERIDEHTVRINGAVINDVNVSRGKATIDFGAGYIQLSHTQEVLLRTSVVKSLLQIQGIDGVLFSVNGSSLLDNDKMPVGLMEASTILTDDGQADIYSAKKKVKMYYTNETGDKLIPYLTELTVTDNVPLETQVLLALKNPPASKKNLKSPLPSDFYVNQTQILNNICYVDLSSEVEKAAVNVKEKVTVYAMVNSLTDLDTAYQVQFTIDGKKISKLNEFENFDALLTSDFSLCK